MTLLVALTRAPDGTPLRLPAPSACERTRRASERLRAMRGDRDVQLTAFLFAFSRPRFHW